MKIFTPFFLLLFTVTFAFSQGYFLDFKLTVNETEQGSLSYFSQNENCRSEMNITGTSFSEMNIVNILPANSSKSLYQIDERTKRCTKNDISNDPDWKDYPKEDYKITMIGSETINGYNTRHVKISHKSKSDVLEFWNTTDSINYEDLIKIRTVFSGKPNLYAALKDANAYGFPVRIKITETKEGTEEVVQLDLQKVEKRDISTMMFKTDGYSIFATVKNKKPTEVFLMMMGLDPNHLPED